jgi:hypothetical protein|tara:strand:- start:1520 stop:1705 length:186 start_codon:yes stop_codon:yes gene_type:complete
MVEEIVHKKRLSYIDAIVDLCDDTNIDPEDVGKFISNILKDKVEAEARNLNYLPKQNTLPI